MTDKELQELKKEYDKEFPTLLDGRDSFPDTDVTDEVWQFFEARLKQAYVDGKTDAAKIAEIQRLIDEVNSKHSVKS